VLPRPIGVVYKAIVPIQWRIRLRPEFKRRFVLKTMPKNSICAEVGVFMGDFSKEILKIIKPKKLHLIDPWAYPGYEKKYKYVANRFKSEIASGQVSIERGTAHDVVNKFPDNYFDWVYLDGGHRYDLLTQQFVEYFPKIKKGGYFTGDDYGGYNEWYLENVTKGVDDFIAQNKTNIIQIKNHQYILQKKQ